MSETSAAATEFEFLEVKRNEGTLTAEEGQRWYELAAELGLQLDPGYPAEPAYAPYPGQVAQGYYADDGLWYPYPPMDPSQAYGAPVHPGYAAQSYDPNTGYAPYPPQGYPPPGYGYYPPPGGYPPAYDANGQPYPYPFPPPGYPAGAPYGPPGYAPGYPYPGHPTPPAYAPVDPEPPPAPMPEQIHLEDDIDIPALTDPANAWEDPQALAAAARESSPLGGEHQLEGLDIVAATHEGADLELVEASSELASADSRQPPTAPPFEADTSAPAPPIEAPVVAVPEESAPPQASGAALASEWGSEVEGNGPTPLEPPPSELAAPEPADPDAGVGNEALPSLDFQAPPTEPAVEHPSEASVEPAVMETPVEAASWSSPAAETTDVEAQPLEAPAPSETALPLEAEAITPAPAATGDALEIPSIEAASAIAPEEATAVSPPETEAAVAAFVPPAEPPLEPAGELAAAEPEALSLHDEEPPAAWAELLPPGEAPAAREEPILPVESAPAFANENRLGELAEAHELGWSETPAQTRDAPAAFSIAPMPQFEGFESAVESPQALEVVTSEPDSEVTKYEAWAEASLGPPPEVVPLPPLTEEPTALVELSAEEVAPEEVAPEESPWVDGPRPGTDRFGVVMEGAIQDVYETDGEAHEDALLNGDPSDPTPLAGAAEFLDAATFHSDTAEEDARADAAFGGQIESGGLAAISQSAEDFFAEPHAAEISEDASADIVEEVDPEDLFAEPGEVSFEGVLASGEEAWAPALAEPAAEHVDLTETEAAWDAPTDVSHPALSLEQPAAPFETVEELALDAPFDGEEEHAVPIEPAAEEIELEEAEAEEILEPEEMELEEFDLVEEVPAAPMAAHFSAVTQILPPIPELVAASRPTFEAAPATAPRPAAPVEALPASRALPSASRSESRIPAGAVSLAAPLLRSPTEVPATHDAYPSRLPAPAAERDVSASFIEGEHRVIIHTVEGQVKRGTIRDLDLMEATIPLEQSGAPEAIPTARVKAIFFMAPTGSRPPSAEGQKIRVTFNDGRQVAGFSQDFNGSDPGFFVIPADNRTNTARIYIFRSSVQAVAEG